MLSSTMQPLPCAARHINASMHARLGTPACTLPSAFMVPSCRHSFPAPLTEQQAVLHQHDLVARTQALKAHASTRQQEPSHSAASSSSQHAPRKLVPQQRARQQQHPVDSTSWSQDWGCGEMHQEASLARPRSQTQVQGAGMALKTQTAGPGSTAQVQQGQARSVQAGVQQVDSKSIKSNTPLTGRLISEFESLGLNVNVKWAAAVASSRGMVKHLLFPSSTSLSLPKLKQIIIVEGLADAAAVHKAVHAVVYVCGGSSVKSAAAAHALHVLGRWPWGLVILTDPDAPGRELRMFLDDALVQQPLKQQAAAAPAPAGTTQAQPQQQQPPSGQGQQQQAPGLQRPQGRAPRVKHAFVRVIHATAQEATKWHEAGSTGIENASPAVVLDSLRKARSSFADSRREFSVQDLQQLGLANTFDSQQGSGAKLRRQLLCDSLGIDNCTGKSLTTALNRFFERTEFDAALAYVNATLPLSNK